MKPPLKRPTSETSETTTKKGNLQTGRRRKCKKGIGGGDGDGDVDVIEKKVSNANDNDDRG